MLSVTELIGFGEGGGIVAIGGTITDVNGWRIHSFNSSGTFQILSGSGLVESLVVGSGAGGGGTNGGGGGGAGEVAEPASVTLGIGSFPIVVGAGGAVDAGGNSSSFNGTTASAGGRGGSYIGGNNGQNGTAGAASGGGAAVGGTLGTTFSGGSGVAGKGFAGGNATGATQINTAVGGGGGGAGAAGVSGTKFVAGNGGIGKQSSITGTATYYGGGGAGNNSFLATTHGLGDGPNSGGGGNGLEAGNSGVVIVRYRII